MAKHRDELAILADFLPVLADAIDKADKLRAATVVATMQQALHMIDLDVDPHNVVAATITHSNGRYTGVPAFLLAEKVGA